MAEELRQALAELVRLTDHNPEAKALLEGVYSALLEGVYSALVATATNWPEVANWCREIEDA